MSWTGKPAVPYPGSGPQKCLENQRPNNEPSLANMTSKALSLLDNVSKENKKGFFLQVEGLQLINVITMHSHVNKLERL